MIWTEIEAFQQHQREQQEKQQQNVAEQLSTI
jgi:hypothetical protein